jgi:hypothetical protein
MQLQNKNIERRIFGLGAGLVALGALVAWPLFGAMRAVSFLSGGALAAANLAALRRTLNSLILTDSRQSKRAVLLSYFLRLLLIPLILYAMIRFLFLSVPAAVGGFAVFSCSIFVEGILEAVSSNSNSNARTK